MKLDERGGGGGGGGGGMDDVISLSSDDSDVEIVGSYSQVLTQPDALSEVRVDVDAVDVPPHYINLTDPKWAFPELKLRKRQNTTDISVIDLTEKNASLTEQETDNLPPNGCQLKQEGVAVNQILHKQDFKLQRSSPRDSSVFAPQQDCGDLKPKERCLNSQTQHQKQSCKAHPCRCTPVVKLARSSFLETHVLELTSRRSVYLTKDCTHMSLCSIQGKQEERRNTDKCETPDCVSNLMRTITASTSPHMEPSLDESPPRVGKSLIGLGQQESTNEFVSTPLQDEESQHLRTPADSFCSEKGSSAAASKEHSTREDEREDFCSSILVPAPSFTSSSQDKAQTEVLCSNLEPLELYKAESRQSYLSNHSSPHSLITGQNSPELFDSLSRRSSLSYDLKSQVDPPWTSENVPAEDMSEWPLMTDTYEGDLENDSPVSFLWQGGSDGEDMNEESGFDMNFREVSREDRHFVCPVALRKLMGGSVQTLIEEDDEGFGTPEVLCRQSLSLVYSTIDEKYPEGTLQLLSDLLQPGYYPPKNITSHLLHGILLDPQCPHHLCVQAFNLLMRTQRHHMADKTTVPWDWELLASVMANQDHTKRHRCEVVRMLLEYVVQTLEDDFQAKRFTSVLHHSIAKATLSCDLQFPQVRDIIKWLFSAIVKSTEHGDDRETVRERDEQIRMVSIFQRMLSLALEVDRSPALNCAKLSQELFHMLISNVPLRAHRMRLLESLQSKLLRCKLLEHLLDYACPLKISLPMSLSLLLHFLKNCTLAPDPTDGTERWQKWEELVHLLWMLLLSYNRAMKGYLCSSFTEQRDRVGTLVYKPDDRVSKSDVREAVQAFLSRSQADLGQALPLHVEESLTYLHDHLLDVCQC